MWRAGGARRDVAGGRRGLAQVACGSVNRRSLTIAVPLALAVLASGCTTLPDNDVAARVDGTELGQDEFEQRLAAAGITTDQAVPLDPARAELTLWIQSQLVDAADVAAQYDAGPAVGGSICLSAIVTETEAEAETAADRLREGDDFADVFAAANIDPTLVAETGALPCITSLDLDAAAGTPLIDAATTLSADTPVATTVLLDNADQPVAWAVLEFRTFDQLAPADIEFVTASVDLGDAAADADIHVDPRYGTFDAELGQVIALG